MNKETLLKYSTPLPRYTSYPTAPHFSPAVGSETYSGWLGSLRPSDSLSLLDLAALRARKPERIALVARGPEIGL